MAIGTQFGFALAGFTPAIAGSLMNGDAGNRYRVALFAAGAVVVSAVAVATGPNGTHKVATPDLGSMPEAHTSPVPVGAPR